MSAVTPAIHSSGAPRTASISSINGRSSRRTTVVGAAQAERSRQLIPCRLRPVRSEVTAVRQAGSLQRRELKQPGRREHGRESKCRPGVGGGIGQIGGDAERAQVKACPARNAPAAELPPRPVGHDRGQLGGSQSGWRSSIMAATITTSQTARKPATVSQNGGSSTSSHNGSPCPDHGRVRAPGTRTRWPDRHQGGPGQGDRERRHRRQACRRHRPALLALCAGGQQRASYWKISVVQSPFCSRTSWARAGPPGRSWKSTKKLGSTVIPPSGWQSTFKSHDFISG